MREIKADSVMTKSTRSSQRRTDFFFFPPAKSGLKASPVQEVEEKKKKKKKKHVSPLSPCCSDDALSAPMWTDADGRGGERHASASPRATTMWLRQPGVSTAGTRVCVCSGDARVWGDVCLCMIPQI